MSVLLLLTNSMWKWNKLLMALVLFEVISSILLFLMINYCLTYLVIMMMFLFFVSEALVVISCLYGSLRVVGMVFSSLSLL